jgi:hypothetical protein
MAAEMKEGEEDEIVEMARPSRAKSVAGGSKKVKVEVVVPERKKSARAEADGPQPGRVYPIGPPKDQSVMGEILVGIGAQFIKIAGAMEKGLETEAEGLEQVGKNLGVSGQGWVKAAQGKRQQARAWKEMKELGKEFKGPFVDAFEQYDTV